MVITGLVVFLSGLAVFSYLGYYNRYWADDWCYNADFSRLGFWGTMKGYTYITTYASNRFSLTLFSGLLYFGSLPGVQLMTLVIVIFWVWGLYRLFHHIAEMTSLRLSSSQILLVTVVIVYYSIYLAPHLYQSFYWKSGTLPYTFPIVFGVWVFALITSRAVQDVRERPLMVAVGILSFFGGGFSEAGSATLTAMLALYVFTGLIFRRMNWARNTLPIAVVALIASVAAMVVLIASPTTAYRVGLYEGTASILEFPRILLYYTYEFFVTDVLGMPLTHLVIFGTLFMIGMLPSPWMDRRVEIKKWLLAGALIAALTFIVVAVSFSPSMYIEQGPPAPRTGVISQFVFILGYGLIAVGSGAFLQQRTVANRHLTWVVLMALIMFYAYGVRSVVLIVGKIPVYAERAVVWDERDAQIKSSKEQGILEVNVHGIDGLPVGGIRDFTETRGSGFWINRCASRYYGVETIYATLP